MNVALLANLVVVAQHSPGLVELAGSKQLILVELQLWEQFPVLYGCKKTHEMDLFFITLTG
jgi:hypothetical protein